MNINETSSISVYRKLVKLRDLLKNIQQLSWNINQFEKKYPLEKATEKDYPEILNSYVDFLIALDGIAHFAREETVDDPIIEQNEVK